MTASGNYLRGFESAWRDAFAVLQGHGVAIIKHAYLPLRTGWLVGDTLIVHPRTFRSLETDPWRIHTFVSAGSPHLWEQLDWVPTKAEAKGVW